MAAKIITALILLIINLGAGFIFLFMLGLSLNGFSERDTNLSFILYFIGVAVIAILSIGSGILLINWLVNKKEFNAVLSVIGVSISFLFLVAAADFVLMLAGAIVAGEVRKSYLP